MSVRVGRCFYSGGKRHDPEFPNFTQIIVLSKSASEWGVLGPYELKDEYGRIHEYMNACGNLVNFIQRLRL